MLYWVALVTASVVIGTLVVFSIVGLLEALREPTLEGTVDNDLLSSAANESRRRRRSRTRLTSGWADAVPEIGDVPSGGPSLELRPHSET